MDETRTPSGRTLAAQALGWAEPTYRGVVPAIYPSASYERGADGRYPGGHSYTRDQNPTYDQAETLLARLEQGEDALLFSSGMAAGTAVLELLEPGDHLIVPEQMYWTMRSWMRTLSARRGVELHEVPNGDLDALRAALRPGRTRIVWLETPSNPTCAITDIGAATEAAHEAGALVVADNTVATPALCRPLSMGVDVVMHSATKQLNGHADVLAGALVTRDKGCSAWERVRHERAYRGAVLGPFEAWLLLRGMRTLFLRVAASADNARRIATYLSAHDDVERVMYPGLDTHPGHAIAAAQMSAFGFVVSFCPRGGEDRARSLANALGLFKQATSLGGVESLVEHRASVEGPDSPLGRNLLRLSIGIEDADDLIADLGRALSETR